NIFKNNWVNSDYAVITTGETFPDALSAAPLAKKYNAPIILTKPDSLSTEVINQLKKTGVTKAFLIGAEWAVSKNIENQLKNMNITPTRIYGPDRYSTNLAIAKYLSPNGEVAIATGEDFPDALSIASIAASSNMPILLVDKNTISDDVTKYIKDNKIKNAYIIGGTGVISANSEKYLSQFTTVKRLSGSNRYETNVNVLTYFQDRLRLGETYFATGLNFPDALSGSVLAAAGSHPIILADQNPDISTIRFILANPGLGQCIFGGDGVLSDSVIKNLIN
ncbi:cell wall-binding repeat-containing protein, partial [Desulfosporosinus sp. SYSU MS00001]|uniref:cell wall-binding repeat-containing protein n=1 Tax=Desulfosporosinus sp. SYSU MS00001 TaxID=3416284 RepID=UPI003CEE06CB